MVEWSNSSYFDLYCLFGCWQPVHNFSFISQESMSQAMRAAEQDMKQKKEAAKNHSVDSVRYHLSHQTKIVNSQEYVKRLKRRQQRDSRVRHF